MGNAASGAYKSENSCVANTIFSWVIVLYFIVEEKQTQVVSPALRGQLRVYRIYSPINCTHNSNPPSIFINS